MGKKKEEFYFVFGLVKIKLRANIQRDREKKRVINDDQYTMSLIGPCSTLLQGRGKVSRSGGLNCINPCCKFSIRGRSQTTFTRGGG